MVYLGFSWALDNDGESEGFQFNTKVRMYVFFTGFMFVGILNPET